MYKKRSFIEEICSILDGMDSYEVELNAIRRLLEHIEKTGSFQKISRKQKIHLQCNL
jgi:hypothetical protein